MLRRIKVFGHPLHPMLTAFPIVFYFAAFAGFIIYAIDRDYFWFRAAFISNIIGLGAAVITALAGFIEFIYIQNRNATITAWKHLLLNFSAFVFFTINLVLGIVFKHYGEQNSTLPILLSGTGIFFTTIAAYLGWELVQKHHVGVDHLPKKNDADVRV